MKISPEERFKELFFDQIVHTDTTYFCNLSKSYHIIDYLNRKGELIGEYNGKYNYFWVSDHKIWLPLKSKLNLSDKQRKNLIKDI